MGVSLFCSFIVNHHKQEGNFLTCGMQYTSTSHTYMHLYKVVAVRTCDALQKHRLVIFLWCDSCVLVHRIKCLFFCTSVAVLYILVHTLCTPYGCTSQVWYSCNHVFGNILYYS